MKTAWKIAILGIGLIALLYYLFWPLTRVKDSKGSGPHCITNLKMLGIAVRVWEGDHHEQYPWNVSTNQGGTRELCAADKDGFDTNAALHFQVLSNELGNPFVLVCPQDRSKKPEKNFQSLRSTSISYRLRTGTNITETNAGEILAVCPIDGNTLYCDGSVTAGKSAHK